MYVCLLIIGLLYDIMEYESFILKVELVNYEWVF